MDPATDQRRSLTRAGTGYAFAVLSAVLFCGNGATARVLLDDGMAPGQLSLLRAAVTFACLIVFCAVAEPSAFRVGLGDAVKLAAFGVGGLAMVNFAYFVAIERLGVGVGLTLEYLGPIVLLIWLRFRYRRAIAARVWIAALVAFAGCVLVIRGWRVESLDLPGVVAGLAAACGFAAYAWGAERSGHTHSPITTLLWFSGAASAAWCVAQPPWQADWSVLAPPGHLAAAGYVCLAGTLGGFAAAFAAVRRIPAARAAVVMTLEPALASIIAWGALGESLAAVQVAGGVIVLAAVAWIQAQRSAGPEEQAPPL